MFLTYQMDDFYAIAKLSTEWLLTFYWTYLKFLLMTFNATELSKKRDDLKPSCTVYCMTFNLLRWISITFNLDFFEFSTG